jgi:hypothetical protein
MERPATKMQVIKIDPEMLLELSRKKEARALGELGAADEASEAERVTLPIVPKKTTVSATASPWTAEAVEIDKSALPSALAPSVRSVPVPASVTPVSAGRSGKARRRMLVPVVGLVVGAVVAFVVVEMMPKAPANAERPESSAMAVASAAPVASAPSVPMAPSAVPVASAAVDAGARAVPVDDAGVPSTVKPKGSGSRKNDDPYDAATPGPVKTADPVVPPPSLTVIPSPPPPIGGDRVFGN